MGANPTSIVIVATHRMGGRSPSLVCGGPLQALLEMGPGVCLQVILEPSKQRGCREGLAGCVVWKGFPAFPAHLRMRPVSRGNSSVWNPRVFADDARGWQCPFVLCLPPQG